MNDRSSDPLPSLHEHAQFLRAVARRLVVDPATADDLVQETFLRALRQPAPPRLGSVRGWLATVVRNVFRDQRAADRARQRRERELADRIAHDPGPADDPFGIDQLSRALQALPVDYRHALQLRYYAQLSLDEMAAELGVPVATVKTRLHRGLKLLRVDLGARAGGAHRLPALLAPLLGAPVAVSGAAVWTPPLLGMLLMKKLALVVLFAAAVLLWAGSDRWWGPEPAVLASLPPVAPAVATDDASAAATSAATASPMAAADRQTAVDRVVLAGGERVGGRIAYRSTGQGVPFARVVVRDVHSHEELHTDAEGHFRTAGGFAANAEITAEGALVAAVAGANGAASAPSAADRTFVASASGPTGALLLSRPATTMVALESVVPPPSSQETWLRVDACSEVGVVELPVEPGPTYFLRMSMPADCAVGDFRIAMARDRLAAVAWLRDWAGGSVRLQQAADGRLWCRAPRPGRDGDGAFLVAYSQDGRWAGRAAVASCAGVQTVPVVVELQPCGIVRGVVRDVGGAPRGGLWVEVVRTDANTVQTTYDRTDAEGNYCITHVEPGPARLQVTAEELEPWRQPIEVPAGRELEQDIVLRVRPIGGAIAGTIATTSGERFAACSVILTSRNDSSIWRTANISWQPTDGRQRASFAFDHVPLVECEVTLHTFAPCGVSVRQQSVTPPRDGVAFQIDDRVAMVPVRFVVGEAGASSTPGVWSLLLTGDAGWQVRLIPGRDGQLEPVELPNGQAFTWRLTGEQVRMRSDRATVGTGGEITIRTAAGWSVQLDCTDIANYFAARDVAVSADGVPVGVTDAEGRLCIDLPAEPRTLGFDARVWRVYEDESHHSDLDGATGTVRPGKGGGRLHCYLQRVY